MCLPAAVILGGRYTIYRSLGEEQETAASSNYKEETVRRGSVSAGINESGTIAYGTTEQGFLHGRGNRSIGFFIGFFF